MASQDQPMAASTRVYTPFLRLYDFLVHRINSPFLWRCSTVDVLVPLFNRNRTANHVDIGVGTGYFLTRTSWPSGSRVHLVDLNPACLTMAATALKRVHPSVSCQEVYADFLTENWADDALREKATSISVMYLLHCLQGPATRKATALCRLGYHLTDDGVLFGATILGREAPHNYIGAWVMWLFNRREVFDNWGDGADDFIRPLEAAFESVNWGVEGCVLIFEARKPRR